MTLQELINATILKATGKPTILDQSNSKWSKILGIANAYQQTWQHEPGQHWNSLYNRACQIGSVSAKDAYDLDEDIDFISTAKGDNVYIQAADGKKVEYELVAYDDLKNYTTGNYCAIVAKQLVFNKIFGAADPEYGGKIYVPAYMNVEALEYADDDIQVDNPMWLVYMCAAEYVRNDIVKQNQYNNLIAEANNLMTDMIRRNRAGQVRRVRGSWHNGGGDYASEGAF